jgi:predicted RNase H-like nuclease
MNVGEQADCALPTDRGGPYVVVDGTEGRWVAVNISDRGQFERASLHEALVELLAAYEEADVFAVDVPIGMYEQEPRALDVAARAVIGPRQSTIFMTPSRAVLEALIYADARVVARELTGKGISAQNYALRHTVLDVASRRGRRSASPSVRPIACPKHLNSMSTAGRRRSRPEGTDLKSQICPN